MLLPFAYLATLTSPAYGKGISLTMSKLVKGLSVQGLSIREDINMEQENS